MGAIALFSLGLGLIFLIPTLTYFFAQRMGRNPTLWFFIGLILPGIASVILFFLPDLSEKKKEIKD